MNIYLIERKRADWDEYASAVIVAATPSEARALAADELSSRWGADRAEWLDVTKSDCARISGYDGPRKQPHILHHHLAG